MATRRRTPYLIGVRDLEGRPGEMREQTLAITVPERLGEGLVAVPADSRLDIALRLESVHEGILASARVTGRAEGVCSRCLTEVVEPVEVDFQELFAYSAGESFDYEVHDDHVDLEPLVRDAVVLSLPFQPVCRVDCPGLDPETGKRRERASDSDARVDPRWAALASFQAVPRPDDATHDVADREER